MSSRYSFIVSKPAESDIVSAMRYITETLHNQKAANDLFDKISSAIDNACEFPYSNVTSEYFFISDDKIRHIVIGNYVLFYEIQDDEKRIAVLRFLLARMDFSKIQIKE